MSINMEVNQPNWEVGLYHVMEVVCKYLSFKDLHVLTKVSNLWTDAAEREQSKRLFYLEHLSIKNPLELNMNKLLVKQPHVSLLFFECEYKDTTLLKNRPYRTDGPERLPEKVVSLKVKNYLTTDDVELDRRMEPSTSSKPVKCDFLGMFLSSIEGCSRVNVVWQEYYDLHWTCDDRINHFAELLGLDRKDRPKSTILLFTHSRRGFETANGLIRTSMDPEKERVWMGMFQEQTMTGRSNITGIQRCVNIVAVSISGPQVKTWIASIDSRLSRNHIESELRDLQGRVRRGRRCTGLIYSPVIDAYNRNNEEFMRSVKRILPDISFVALFNSALWSKAEWSTHWPDEYLISMNFISIVVISNEGYAV